MDDGLKKAIDFINVFKAIDIETFLPLVGVRFTRTLDEREKEILRNVFDELLEVGSATFPVGLLEY